MKGSRFKLNQNHAPIHEALETFRRMRVVPFDVPGHKRGRGNPELTEFLGQKCVGVDVNSMKPLVNLCHPVSVIREAEELAADAFKTDSSMDKNGDGICQYVVLEGEAGHQDSIVRTEYSVNTMAEKGVETEKLGYAIANWNRAQAQTKTAAMLTQFDNKIELIIANNDDMALGAIDALKASQIPKEEWPGVVGIDGTDVGLNAVKNEEMLGTVYNDKEGQAQEMLNLAFAIATNGKTDEIPLLNGKYVRIPYHKVTLDNVEEYENK